MDRTAPAFPFPFHLENHAETRAVELLHQRLDVLVLGPTDAPPLLFVCHFPDVWWGALKLADALARRFRVYYPVAFGATCDLAHSTMESLGRDAVTLLVGLDLGARAFVVGHCFGGVIATHVAHFRPDLVAGLAILDSFHPDIFRVDTELSREIAAVVSYTHDFIADDFEAVAPQGDFAALSLFFVRDPDWPAVREAYLAEYRRPGFLTWFANSYRASFYTTPTGDVWTAAEAERPSLGGRRTEALQAGAPKRVLAAVMTPSPLTTTVPGLYYCGLAQELPPGTFSYEHLSRFMREPRIVLERFSMGVTRYRPEETARILAAFWCDHVRDGARPGVAPPPEPEGEARDAEHLAAIYAAKVASYRCPHLGGPSHALRASHPKAHGVVHATMCVAPDLPAELQVGLLRPGATYPARIRFANLGGAPLEVTADQEADQRGMAVKILDAAPDGEGLVTRHDLLLNSMPVLASKHARDIVPRERDDRLLEALSPHLADAGAQHPLALRYYSQTPYRFGAGRAVKWSAFPRASVLDALDPRDPDAMRAALVHTLAHAADDVVFDLMVQLQGDPVREPLDDDRALWRTPWIAVAELRIPRQVVADQLADPGDEALSFNPWSCPPDHAPLGAVNRIRGEVYRAAAAARHAHNGVAARVAFPFAPTRLRVCIVGSGVAGCAAALALAEAGHEVVIVEQKAELGGHASSIAIGDHAFDPAFGVYTEAVYPNFVALLAKLGLASEPLHAFRDVLTWFTRDGALTWRHVGELPFACHVLDEIRRFDVAAILRDVNNDDVSAGEYLAAHGYSPEFVHYFFLGGIVYLFAGHPASYYLDFPIRPLLAYYYYPGLLTGEEPICRVAGGSGAYMSAFTARLRSLGVTFRTATETTVAARTGRGVTLRFDGPEGAREERFDHLVLATLPDQALRVLADTAEPEDRALLGGFQITSDTVVVHRDARWMPPQREAWRYGNVVAARPEALSPERRFVVTKMTRCTRDGVTPIFATYAYGQRLDIEGGVEVTHRHAKVDRDALRLRRQLRMRQGRNATWLCGAYLTGLTLHEDALTSGLEAANELMGGMQAYPIVAKRRAWEDQRGGGIPWGDRDTLLDVLRFRARAHADRTALVFVGERGEEEERATYASLYATAGLIAAHLRDTCGLKPGDRALLAYPPGIPFIAAFLGCVRAGVIPVPVYPPNPAALRGDIPKLARVGADCGAEVVLTTTGFQRALRLGRVASPLVNLAWPDLRWYPTDALKEGTEGAAPGLRPAPEDVAFLQYTSGSTADPKGVMITHRNLMHQFQITTEALGFSERTVGASWVPPYHDLGLISCLLTALYNGAVYVSMSPVTFIRAPAQFGDLLHRYRVTATAAPDFGYRLLTAKTTPEQRRDWDWSALETVLSAGEPVRNDTLTDFVSTFAPTGLTPSRFCPAYGLAEHTVAVSMFGARLMHVDRAELQVNGRVVHGDHALVGCGAVHPSVTARIVDAESRLALGDRAVGEIWVHSASKARGYWGRPELSAETFEATIEGEEAGLRYLRTGDLGFFDRGELYVTGRCKDLMIVRGRNVYPQDLERTLQAASPRVRPGGVIAFQVDGDTLAAAVEVTAAPRRGKELAALAKQLRARVFHDDGVLLKSLAFVAPRTLPRTTSGKVQRGLCRERFLAGKLRALHVSVVEVDADRDAVPAARRAETRGVLEHLRLAVFDVARVLPADDQPLLEQVALDSIQAVELLSTVKDRLHVDLPVTILASYPTLRALAAHVEQHLAATPHSNGGVVTLGAPDDPRLPPLFLIHPIDGRVECFLDLARRWPGELRALPQPGPFADLASMANAYAEAIRAALPEGPTLVGGFSFGAIVAREVAARLEAEGYPVRAVVQLDPPVLGSAASVAALADATLAQLLGGYVQGDDLAMVKRGLVTAQSEADQRRLFELVFGDSAVVERLVSEATLTLSNGRLLRAHVPVAPLLAPLGVFRAGAAAVGEIAVPGTHVSLLHPPHVTEVAVAMERWLAAVAPETTPATASLPG